MEAPEKRLRHCGNCGVAQTFEKIKDHDPPLYRCTGCGNEYEIKGKAA